MGRRSINTTKSGKYMNPTDQARKEARKKELKKNKKQRQMVRAAVLKNKDPGQILEEMEKIDEMEYNVMQPSPLNEKVLRDKRKKLKETFDRVMRLYHTDEPEQWSDLKRKEMEYEKKRLKKQQYYESVKHAQSVQIDDIPLPAATQMPAAGNVPIAGFPGTVPPNRLPPPPTALQLPAFAPSAPPGMLSSKTNDQKPADKTTDSKKTKDLPSVPPGPPPDLLKLPELDTDAEDDEVVLKEYTSKSKSAKSKKASKPSTLQQRMLAISGHNIDEFMREMESVHKRKQKARQAAGEAASPTRHSAGEDSDGGKKRRRTDSAGDDDDDDDDDADDSNDSDNTSDEDSDGDSNGKSKRRPVARQRTTPPPLAMPSAIPVPIPLPPVPTGLPPHMSAIPGPPMPPVAAGLAPPPGMMFRPPPLRPPGGMPPTFVPRPPVMGGMPPRMGIRMPPGPPPGLPPRMAHHAKHHPLQQQQQQQLQLHKDLGKGVTTITAKPQIRNLSADVTRFVPSTLRVKREETRKPNRSAKNFIHEPTHMADAGKAATKDDAYLQFMNEMQGLL